MLLRIIFRVSAPVFDFKVFGGYFVWHVIKTEQILRDLGDGLAILAAITCDSVDEVNNFYSIANVSFIFTHVDARKDQWSNQMCFYFLNGSSWWSNCCVLTPNNLTVLDGTGAENLEVCFNHMFCQFAKDKNEQTLSYQKATRTPFNLSSSKLFQVFRETTSWSSKWLQFDNLWTREIDDGWVQGCSLSFGMMPVPCRFNGINMKAPEFDRCTLFWSEAPARCRDPLLSSNTLQYLCDFVVSFLWLPGNPCCWTTADVCWESCLPFCGDFPGCGAILISRCNTHLANTQNLQQQHTHFFLSKNNTCSIWATLLAL